jgi:eukaryotic-like serine/threonine-protein kinase
MSDPQFAAFETAIADRFTVEGPIGRGSRAIVYRAQDRVRGGTVALKVLHSDLASALDYGRFCKEMGRTRQLSHPGIIPVVQVGELAGRLVVVTPFLDGETLRSRLTRELQLEVADAVRITREIADALRYAHDNDVLHKDVKPENILLTPSRAMLMDLGVSRAITRAMEETQTGTGLTLGTPAYMSPEQASGGVEIDARADLYSLGCVFYEMLSGETPFTGATPQAVLLRTLTDTPVPISVHRDALPADVGVTIDRLLARTPGGRFPDAGHVVEALRTIGS